MVAACTATGRWRAPSSAAACSPDGWRAARWRPPCERRGVSIAASASERGAEPPPTSEPPRADPLTPTQGRPATAAPDVRPGRGTRPAPGYGPPAVRPPRLRLPGPWGPVPPPRGRAAGAGDRRRRAAFVQAGARPVRHALPVVHRLARRPRGARTQPSPTRLARWRPRAPCSPSSRLVSVVLLVVAGGSARSPPHAAGVAARCSRRTGPGRADRLLGAPACGAAWTARPVRQRAGARRCSRSSSPPRRWSRSGWCSFGAGPALVRRRAPRLP